MDKSLFKRATEDTPDATPGYMFRDIAQWTFVDQNTQAKLVAALFDKLQPKTSVHVLAKVLRIIKVLCETGHADFQKEMQRRSDQMKDYASYRGPVSPQFGDRLNEKVRIAAKEAIDAAFTARKDTKIQLEAGHGSDTTSKPAAGITSNITSAITNVFSSTTSTHTPVTFGQGGDGRVAAMPTTNKWADHMARAGNEDSMPVAAVNAFVDKAKLGFGLFGSENIKSKEDRIREAEAEVGEFRPVDIALVGASRGPFGHHATTSSATAVSNNNNNANWKFSSNEAESGLPPVEQHASLGRFLTPYQREVERLSVLKNAPQRVDITQFIAAVKEIHDQQGLSYEDLAQTLDEYIAQKHPWQSRLNVMTLIEALVKAELSSEIGDYFNENPEDVQRNVHVVQSSLKDKSQKVLRLLGIPERSTATAPATSTFAQSNQAAGGLDFNSMTITRKSRRGGNKGATADDGGAEEEENFEPAAVAPVSTQQQQQSASASSNDPTKLRKRAQMNTDDFMSAPAPAPVAQPVNTNSGWGNSNAGNDGWGTSAGTGGWGASAGNSEAGWGSNTSTKDWQSPAASLPTSPTPNTQQQVKAGNNKAAMDFDDLFGGPTVPAQQKQQQPTHAPPAPTTQPMAIPQSHTPQQPNPQMAVIQQMQQQVQTMLSQINMNDPNALAQMQMLMQQQQQLMVMVQQVQQQQQQQAAPQGNSPVQPHGTFNAPALNKDGNSNKFADVQAEMVNMLMADARK